MNERINELIEECTSVNDDVVYDGSDVYMKTTEYFDKDKFAELVAAQEREECAAMCMAVPRTGAYFARLIRARGTT